MKTVAAKNISILQVLTLVLWISFSGVALAGLLLGYPRPKLPAKIDPPMQAEMIKVELSSDPVPPVPTEATPPPQTPPPMAQAAQETPIPTLTPVAEANAAVAFALPTEGPVRIVQAKEASYARATTNSVSTPLTSAPVRTLTFGQGEGKQPAPDYPRRSILEGQEGTVIVIFAVGENGHVLSAEASKPSLWPLLNEAALRAVQGRWKFPSGAVRRYEVAISFQLQK